MILLLLSLLVSASSGIHLIEHFECGSPTNRWSILGAKAALHMASCSEIIQDETNLCCKEHDLCYEMHDLRNYTREFCDMRFCNCLQDARDRVNDNNNYCNYATKKFCRLASSEGGKAFIASSPHSEADDEKKFGRFVDARPLGLDMQRLMDSCRYAKSLANHCHNTVYKCLQKQHERYRRLDVVEHSYQDCRSTMHDCMQVVIESEPNSQCAEVAADIAKQANTYMELDEAKHGRSIIETYPIVAARLIKQCNESHIEPCLLDFHNCAQSQENRSEHPEMLNAARKIKIGCHRELRACIDAVAVKETSEDCIEARNLAVGRIRDKDLKDVKRSIRAGRGYLPAIDGPRR